MKVKVVVLRERKKRALLKEIRLKVDDTAEAVYLCVRPSENILTALLRADHRLKAVVTFPSLADLTTPRTREIFRLRRIVIIGKLMGELSPL